MTILNKKQFTERLRKNLINHADKNIGRAMFKASNLVKNTAVESILRGAKSGSIVQKYNPSRSHQQSAPGEPPASDTGFLAANITSRVAKNTLSYIEYVGQVVATAEYAKHLEYGTVNMSARPFLRPALRNNAKAINDIFKKEGIIS